MRRFGLIAAAATACFTAGCVSLLPETEPNTLYRLAGTGTSLDADVFQSATITVLVDRIAAPRGLAGDRIAILRGDAIAYMAGAAWISPAPNLIETAIMDAFYETAPLIAPARAEDGVRARYELNLELRHFEASYDQGDGAAPLVRTALRARLINRDTRSPIAARTLERTARASTNRQGAIVAAFSSAAAELSREVAVWTQDSVCAGDDAPEACTG
ncbi:ABC-type transport auxiliary lipoprotein family protein [Maricaulaceae bacterium MS644]